MDLRRLIQRPPLNVVVELLHDSQPLFKHGCGVIGVVIGRRPEERRERQVAKHTEISECDVLTQFQGINGKSDGAQMDFCTSEQNFSSTSKV